MNNQLNFLDPLDKSMTKDAKNLKLLLYKIRDFKLLKSRIIQTIGNYSSVSKQYTPLLDAKNATERTISYLFAILGCYSYKQKEFKGKSLKEIRFHFEGSDNPIMGSPYIPSELLKYTILTDCHTRATLRKVAGDYWTDSITPSVLDIIDKYDTEVNEIISALDEYNFVNHEKNRK